MSETGIIETPLSQETDPVEMPEAAPPVDPPHEKLDSTAEQAASDQAIEDRIQEEQEFLRKLPPEIGALLVMIGVAGVFLPGVIGTPLIIAGAVVVWPKTFEPIERKFAKWYPGPHREGIRQIKRFISDLNRRFPDSTGPGN